MIFARKRDLDNVLYRSSKYSKLAKRIIEYHKVKDPKKKEEIAKDIAKNYLEAVVGFILLRKRKHLSEEDKREILKKYLKLKYFPNEDIQIVCTEEENIIYNGFKKLINVIVPSGDQYKRNQYKKQKIIKINCTLEILELSDIYIEILNTIANYIQEKEYKREKINPYNPLFWNFRKIRKKIDEYKEKREIYKRIETVLEEAASYFLSTLSYKSKYNNLIILKDIIYLCM